MVIEQTANRIGIFFFYDQEGKVDRYVTYLLQGMLPCLSRLVIVCNGILSPEGRTKFEKFSSEIFVKDNSGFDVGAYKYAIDYIGWDELCKYDEAIIFNHTIMGPVYPFEDMFSTMSERDLDFWGITRHYSLDYNPFGKNEYGYLPEHIQSHFLVFRKSLMQSKDFQLYWDELPQIKTYEEAIGVFETIFTKRFEDKGFLWDTYVDTEDIKYLNQYLLMTYPKLLIEKKQCPIFKRRTFFQSYEYMLHYTTGQSAEELFSYLKESGLYDVDLIWENILRTCNQADFVKNLQLKYVFSSKAAPCKKVETALKTRKLALIMHLYYMDILLESFQYAKSMPESVDVYITTNSEEKKQKIESVFAGLKCHKLEVRVIENRGRDVSSLLVGVKDVIMDYDIACFAHDKKVMQIDMGSIGESFSYKCFENVLHNKTYVYNVIDCFLENTRLGILSPPLPNHGNYFPLLGLEWSLNYELTIQLAKELGINVPMSKEKEPVGPFGTVFWFRPAALKYLYAKNWEYTDFPLEPNNQDGTILHAVERIYSFAAQQAGYYPGVLLVDKFAGIELNNLEYYVREYNRILVNNSISGFQSVMVNMLRMRLEEKENDCKQINNNMTTQEQLWVDHPKTLMEYEQIAEQYRNIINSLSWRIISRINRFIDKLRGINNK